MLPITAGTWVETLSGRFDWDRERDADRIHGAFVTLAGTRRQWPLPQDFMDALPPPKTQAQIARAPNIPDTREGRVRHLADLDLMRGLYGKDAAIGNGHK